MSSTHHSHAPGYRAIRWNADWITRPLFGLALAALAIGVLFSPPAFFAALVAAISFAAAWEWHRMVARGRGFHTEVAITAIAVAFAIASLLITRQAWTACLVLAAGAALSGIFAKARHLHPVWQAGGVAYLGLPAIALCALRAFAPGLVQVPALHLSEPRGALILVSMFLIVWATDTGALIFGNLIGGPRMAPVLSPAKTWAGTIGGSLTASLLFMVFIWFLGGAILPALLFALLLSVSAHAGDLFESFVKRRFGIKDSGAMIPGHGGVLDRMDSTLAASLVMAALVFFFGLDPLFGAGG